MSFPKYEDYKDSGVEWLGEVPANWEVIRLANLFQQMAEEGTDDLPILSVSIHSGVSDKEMNEEEMDRKVTRSDDLSKYKRVMPGDLVYNMMRAWQGGFGAVTIAGMVSPAYVVARPTRSFITEFIEQQLRTPNAVEEMRRNSRGVTDFRLRLYWEEFKTIQVVLPPFDDQRRIMEELNGETSKIDALITEQRTLIDLLKEKRQAVISHAVTKGLDPRVPMKDSGVEWLGEVPAHWDVAAVNYRYEVLLGKMLDEKRITGNHLAPYLRNVDVQWDRINTDDLPSMDFSGDDLNRFSLIDGDLLVCEGGEVGRAAIWNSPLRECYYQKALHRLRRKNEQSDTSRFMFYVLRMATSLGVFDASGGKSTIAHLPAEALRRFRFAYPPKREQDAIIDYLDAEKSRLDALTAEAQTTIALLQERRSALISAAVTGKIDVRGTAFAS